MKLVSVAASRVTWLFETREMNPQGLDLHPVYVAIKNRYNFATPRSREEIETAKDGIKFQHGVYKPDGTNGFSIEFTSYNDGLVADSMASTQLTEAFLDDLTSLARKQFSLAFTPQTVYKRKYASSLLVESEIGLSRITQGIAEIASCLSEATGRPFETTGLTLGPDGSISSDFTQPFTIERRVGVPFATNRFFSNAPLQTDAHLALLEKFESLMK